MKKKILNIRPQEVVANGQRSLRYKGSDGKFHGIASGNGGSNGLSVEDVTRTLTFLNPRLQNDMQITEFLMRYSAGRIKSFAVDSIDYSSTSSNRIYFDNGVLGSSPCYFDLSGTVVNFCQANGAVIDSIERETFNTDVDATKAFFEHAIAMKIEKISPYNMYYFMVKSGFVIAQCSLTIVEKHLFGLDQDGTQLDYGIIYPAY